jgi:hypothetical protein
MYLSDPQTDLLYLTGGTVFSREIYLRMHLSDPQADLQNLTGRLSSHSKSYPKMYLVRRNIRQNESLHSTM